MKKFLLLPLMAVAMVLIPTIPAQATFDLPEIKVTLCHYANGHSHAISVNINAVDTHLVWHIDTGWQPTPGHLHDRFLHIGAEVEGDDDENCAGDDAEPISAFICFEGEVTTITNEDGDQAALNLQVSAFLEENDGAVQVEAADSECVVEEPTTTTTTTAPPKQGEPGPPGPVGPQGPPGPAGPSTLVAAPVAAPLPAAAPVAAPANELPRTGSGALGMLFGGIALVCAGATMRILSKLRRETA